MKNKELLKLLNNNERSQAWLARKLNYTAMAISKWCTGQVNIPNKHIPKIKELLK
tara:strand:+ start:1691 stop:1855 length:165 start_codon:yes stop_codon:yes gene_type:complete